MSDIILFAHMMKTAGTSFSKSLIGHFGSRMHIVPGGLILSKDYYEPIDLQNDLNKAHRNLQILSGHPLRPYKDFENCSGEFHWITFFRDPVKRYISHYFDDLERTKHFSFERHPEMSDDSIIEWEKFENNANYQTRFIAGEPNFDKAVEILETKFEWIGITEEFQNGLLSFKQRFNIENFNCKTRTINSNHAKRKKVIEVEKKYIDFINEKNSVDLKLYDYVKNNLWPKYRIQNLENYDPKSTNKIKELMNMLLFQLHRQSVYKTEKFKLKNLKTFYERWYK